MDPPAYPAIPKTIAVGVVVALSGVGVLADWMLKLASQQTAPWKNPYLFAGAAIYAATAFGWVYILRHLKLASIGGIYCVSTVILLTALGRIVFHEKLSGQEIIGLTLALISVCLLWRQAA